MRYSLIDRASTETPRPSTETPRPSKAKCVIFTFCTLLAVWAVTVRLAGGTAPVQAATGRPIVEPIGVYRAAFPSKARAKQMAAQTAGFWNATFISRAQRLPFLGQFLKGADAFPVLPHAGERLAEPDLAQARNTFWIPVLTLQWVLMGACAKGWHKVLTGKADMPPRARTTRIIFLFFTYHLTHHVVLYALVDFGVVHGLLSQETGLDYELWNAWATWLLVVVNVTAVAKYTMNYGAAVADSTFSVLMQLAPGLGSDIHLAKDWVFVGVCAMQAKGTSGPAHWLATALVLLSIGAAFSPLVTLAREQDVGAATSYIAAHWPIVVAGSRVEASAFNWDDGLYWADHFWAKAVVPQVTKSKEMVALWNELPQAACELAFGVAFGFEPFVVFAIVVSLAKVTFIRSMRGTLAATLSKQGPETFAAWVAETGDGDVLGVPILDVLEENRQLWPSLDRGVLLNVGDSALAAFTERLRGREVEEPILSVPRFRILDHALKRLALGPD